MNTMNKIKKIKSAMYIFEKEEIYFSNLFNNNSFLNEELQLRNMKSFPFLLKSTERFLNKSTMEIVKNNSVGRLKGECILPAKAIRSFLVYAYDMYKNKIKDTEQKIKFLKYRKDAETQNRIKNFQTEIQKYRNLMNKISKTSAKVLMVMGMRKIKSLIMEKPLLAILNTVLRKTIKTDAKGIITKGIKNIANIEHKTQGVSKFASGISNVFKGLKDTFSGLKRNIQRTNDIDNSRLLPEYYMMSEEEKDLFDDYIEYISNAESMDLDTYLKTYKDLANNMLKELPKLIQTSNSPTATNMLKELEKNFKEGLHRVKYYENMFILK